jgi:hypothetical protein
MGCLECAAATVEVAAGPRPAADSTSGMRRAVPPTSSTADMKVLVSPTVADSRSDARAAPDFCR